MDAAVRAIETIVEQGEGPRGDWRNAHFGRFLKVLDEYLAMMQANPGLEVARPVLPALVRPPESGEEADLITDPRTAGIADLGNVGYELPNVSRRSSFGCARTHADRTTSRRSRG